MEPIVENHSGVTLTTGSVSALSVAPAIDIESLLCFERSAKQVGEWLKVQNLKVLVKT